MDEVTESQTFVGLQTPAARAAARSGLFVWAAITLAAVAELIWTAARGHLGDVLQQGPGSDLHVTVLAVATAWALAGGALAAVAFWSFEEPLFPAAAFAIGLLYVNVLRERLVGGDVNDYVRAALSLGQGLHLPARYLYPPLWATLLEAGARLGPRALYDICWMLNVCSTIAFFVLLVLALERYAFSRRAAIGIAFGFLVVNVPVLRTLVYGQINLHVVNLILVSILLYPRARIWSALAMAVAVHLKLAPAVLVLPFLLMGDIVWLAWWVLGTSLLAVPTLALHGVGPFIDAWHNMQHVYSANGLRYRETSIDAVVRAVWALTGWTQGSRILIVAIKAAVAGAVLLLAWRDARIERHIAGVPGARVLNMMPGLLVLMLLLSPLLWEHHPVFVALPFLLLLHSRLSPDAWTLYAAAYFVTFLLPTLDFFPWSAMRLAALGAWLVLDWRGGSRALADGESPLVEAAAGEGTSPSAASAA